MANVKKLRIAMPVYEGFNLLDFAGPLVFFQADSRLEPLVVSNEGKPETSDQGVTIVPNGTLESATDVCAVWVPGGSTSQFFNQIDLQRPLLRWLNEQMHRSTETILCSVCTGAFVAAAAGWFEGYTATTHWQFLQELALFPGVRVAPGFPRYWLDDNRLSGGGVSSGMDEALALIAILLGDEAAENSQLTNQYAPDPPFRSGTPTTASPRILGEYFKTNRSEGIELARQIEYFLKAPSNALS